MSQLKIPKRKKDDSILAFIQIFKSDQNMKKFR